MYICGLSVSSLVARCVVAFNVFEYCFNVESVDVFVLFLVLLNKFVLLFLIIDVCVFSFSVVYL